MANEDEEEFVPEDEAENSAEALKKLREKLKAAQKEKQEYLDGWQRARADFANFKKEEASLNASKEERIKAEFAEAVIPALDAFDMAFRDATFMKADPNIQKGIEALHQGLLKSLEKVGITRIVPQGEPFNPHLHEALRQMPTEDASLDHTVESVLAPGYKAGERLIRPAQVSIWSHN